MQNYCILHTPARKLIAYITLSGLEEKLPVAKFMKVHKSFIVSLNKITALDGNDLFIGKAHIPVSRSLKDEVMKRVMGENKNELLRNSSFFLKSLLTVTG
jgi:DNA-binding LytR/AlgR family response regulator